MHAFVLISDPGIRVTRHDLGEEIILDPVGRTIFGRSPECTVCVNVMSVNRKNCGVECDRQGNWVLADYGGTNGVFINRVRVRKEHVLQPGDLLHYDDEVTFRFEEVDPDPLLRVVSFGPAVALGGAPMMTAGRRRALLAVAGRVRLVTVLSDVRPVSLSSGGLESPLLARWEGDGLHHVAFADVRGVCVTHLPGAEVTLLSDGDLWPWRDKLIATFDGELWMRPGRRDASSSPEIAHRPSQKEFAARVRGLFPEAWAKEQLLREQVDLLDEEGLSWLVSRTRAAIG